MQPIKKPHAQKNRYVKTRNGLGSFLATRPLNFVMLKSTIWGSSEIYLSTRLYGLMNRALTNPHDLCNLLLGFSPIKKVQDMNIGHRPHHKSLIFYKYYLFFNYKQPLFESISSAY